MALDDPRLKYGMVNKHRRRCEVCELEVSNSMFAKHLLSHNLSPEQYTLKLLSLEYVPKCSSVFCTNNVQFVSLSRGFTNTCSQKCALTIDGRIETISKAISNKFNDEEYMKRHSIRSSKLMRNLNDKRDEDFEYSYLYGIQLDESSIKVGIGQRQRVEFVKSKSVLESPMLFCLYGSRVKLSNLENLILDSTESVDHEFTFSGSAEVRNLKDLPLIKNIILESSNYE